MKKIRIGFVVNPIAGMGGKVGLKGTDGVYEEAVRRGAKPIAFKRAVTCIEEFKKQSIDHDDVVEWYTCNGNMGKNVLDETKIKPYHVVYSINKNHTDVHDTLNVCKELINYKIDLLLFCGGDGTARDIVSIVKESIPLLGIPSGVKMHSGVFGVNPQATGMMISEFIHDRLRIGISEIMDLDESLYRKGIWKVRLYATCKGLIEPTYIQVGKQMFSEISDESVKEELYEHVLDEMTKYSDTLFLFGSGGTLDDIARRLNIDHTLLGIDAVYRNKSIATDVNEEELLVLLKKYHKVKLLLSPIGAQGFIIGRGNLQLSPQVIKRIGIDNIIVLSTPSKILATPVLRVDSGDKELDHLFYDHEMMMVVIGYRLFRVVRIQK
jgi:predicted polyphosphate/ATP-dependent NAD kinase